MTDLHLKDAASSGPATAEAPASVRSATPRESPVPPSVEGGGKELHKSSKTMQPVVGYNHNARHNGQLFHLQTEDSGTRYARIITQLFMDGGRIVKSVKTSYADHLGDPNLPDIIREMMRQQHKAMFIALRDGTFDKAIGTPQPAPAGQDIPGTSALPAAGASRGSLEREGRDDEEITLRRVVDPDEDPPTVRQLPDELSLDLDALERAVQASGSSQGAYRPPSELPPPPPNLLRVKGGRDGEFLFRTPREEPGPPPSGSKFPKAERADRRYAVARPAAIFGPGTLALGRPVANPPLHDDRSLDDMILLYLADHES